MKEQTAVDWLWDEIVNKGRTDYLQLLKQGTLLEKMQHQSTWISSSARHHNPNEPQFFEDYYSKTFIYV